MTQQKLAVTKAGYNVLTETNPNNFIFDSSYNTFKIIADGTYSNSFVAGNNYFNINHNLNSKNGFYVIFNNQVFGGGGFCELPRSIATYSASYDGTGNPTDARFIYDAYNTLNTLTLYLFSPTGVSGTFTAYYMIFEVVAI